VDARQRRSLHTTVLCNATRAAGIITRAAPGFPGAGEHHRHDDVGADARRAAVATMARSIARCSRAARVHTGCSRHCTRTHVASTPQLQASFQEYVASSQELEREFAVELQRVCGVAVVRCVYLRKRPPP
jgi:hypothetical protein